MPSYSINTPGTGLAYNFSDLASNNLGSSVPDSLLSKNALADRQSLIDTTSTNIAANDPMNITSSISIPKGVDIGTNTSSINWGMDGWGGFGLGVGQLGLGIASYLDNKKTADKQRHLMDQQAKQNDYNYNKTIADNKHIQQIFNPNNQ